MRVLVSGMDKVMLPLDAAWLVAKQLTPAKSTGLLILHS